MNRAIIIATTCALGLVLTACGDNSAPKPTVVKPEAPVVVVPPQTDEGTKNDVSNPAPAAADTAPAEPATPVTPEPTPAPAQTPAQ